MRSVVRVALLYLLSALLVLACGGPASAPKAADVVAIDPTRPAATPAQPIAGAGSDDSSSDADARVPVDADDPQRGDRRALVTLVVWSDFQCPFCARLAAGALERLREEYAAEDLRIVFKNQPLPFHTFAKLAAEIGQGVYATRGADAFWRYHDMAFRRQQLFSSETLRQWAEAAGADPNEIDAGLEAKRWTAKVEHDASVGNALGATGTPASFVNGVFVSGAQPYEKFREIVDAELVKAKALASDGVPRGTIYARAVADNLMNTPKGDDDDAAATRTVWRVPVGSSPVRGKANAAVTIIEFADFQCPYCKTVEATLAQIRADYGDRIRVVWKDNPLVFHPRAAPAAELGRAARAQKGDAAFWDVHDRLFDQKGALEDADLERVARAAGLDARRAMAAVAAKAFQKGIDADVDLADDVEAEGTPHFFINGRRLVGAQPYDKWKAIVAEELKKAEALLAKGVAGKDLYETFTRDGKSAPEPETKTVPMSAAAPFRGVANAPVVIQEFADFQCPFCARADPTMDDLLKAYPGKVKIVWRDDPLPMHAQAPLAAEAAREAFAQKGNDGFAKMRAILFANNTKLEEADLASYARQIGLDVARFEKALRAHVHKPAVDADAQVARDRGITGTPSFVVGPYFVSGAQPYSRFRRLVERTLSPPPKPAAPTSAAAAAPGLVVVDLARGAGAPAKNGDTLAVHYTGTLTDGTTFDSSRTRGQPFTFELGKGNVIKGWEQGLVGMKVGGRRKLTIPPDLAYGDRGVGGKIPPKSTLVFEVELLSIK